MLIVAQSRTTLFKGGKQDQPTLLFLVLIQIQMVSLFLEFISLGSTGDLSTSSVTSIPVPTPSTSAVKATTENGGSQKANATEDPDSTLRKAHDFDLESLPAKTGSCSMKLLM